MDGRARSSLQTLQGKPKQSNRASSPRSDSRMFTTDASELGAVIEQKNKEGTQSERAMKTE